MWLCIWAVVSLHSAHRSSSGCRSTATECRLGDAVETPAAAKTDRAKPLLSAICRDKFGCLLFADVVIPSGERFPGMISGHKCYESLHVPASCSFAVSTSKRFVRLFRKDREHGAHRCAIGRVALLQSMYVSADFDRSDPWVGQSLSKLHSACACCFGLCQQLRPAHKHVARWLRCTQV